MGSFLQTQFQNKVVKCRQDEYERMRVERDARINEILQARKEERETKRKMLFYLRVEEERLKKLQEEEEARKLKGTCFIIPLVWKKYLCKYFILYISLSSGGQFGQLPQNVHKSIANSFGRSTLFVVEEVVAVALLRDCLSCTHIQLYIVPTLNPIHLLEIYLNSIAFYLIFNAEAERLKKEEAEKRARLDRIAEIQRQREQEIEERRKASEGLARPELSGGSRPLEAPPAPTVAPAAAAAAPAPGKYVPRFRRAEGQAPPPEPDRWGSGRQDDRAPPPGGDRWRGGGSGGGQRQSWGSSRIPPRGG